MTQRHLHRWLLAVFLAAPLSVLAQPAKDGLAKSAVLESNIAYLRVSDITQDLPAQIQSVQQTLATNAIIGTVLDLRFAHGDDADAAKAIENLFAQEKMPVAILVNNETADAAEQLASGLRADKAGLIFGNSKTLTADIPVVVSAEAETKYMDDLYGTPSTNKNDVAGNASVPSTANHTNTASNLDFLPYIDHTTEADLVREKIKDGLQENAFAPPSSAPAPEQPFIRDPVLARGVDFIKGLAALRRTHS
ncbi:MAG TPA: hypothetical protein VGN23_05610 [Verrucomicrobiae bacterium]|jgi:hypothetical protein